MGGLWAADDGRSEDTAEDYGPRFSSARIRAEREAVTGLVDRRGGSKPAILGPGIVEMSLRGTPEDVERIVAALNAAGFRVWRGDSRGTKVGNEAGYSYFSVEVPGDS